MATLPVPESWVSGWDVSVCFLAAFGQVALPAPCLSFPSLVLPQCLCFHLSLSQSICAVSGFALEAHNNLDLSKTGSSLHSSPQSPPSSPVLCFHGKPKCFCLLTLLPAARRAQCPEPGPAASWRHAGHQHPAVLGRCWAVPAAARAGAGAEGSAASPARLPSLGLP